MDDNEQQIRDRAYQKWLDEGMPEGREDAHWHSARQEIEGIDHGNPLTGTASNSAQAALEEARQDQPGIAQNRVALPDDDRLDSGTSPITQ